MTSLAANKIKRPALRYRGGKWRLGPWIISHFPPHECYVEPFAGGASVLFQKEPSILECINDLDGDVVAFFRVLREQPQDLVRMLELTPYARDELKECHQPVSAGMNDLEKARRLYTRCALGRGTSSRPSGFRPQKSKCAWGKNVTGEFARLEHLHAAAERLAMVQIECLDALEVVRRFDAPGTLFYVDPPYLSENRSGRLYAQEMMDEGAHRALAELLHGIEGMVLLSGGESELYRDLYGGWSVETKIARGEQHKEYTECLWINPAAQAAKVAAEQAEASRQGDLGL